MPTAAKLVAAISFAIVGWIAANVYIPVLGAGYNAGPFRELVALLGLVVGWRVLGPDTGHGYRQSMGSGLKTAVVLVFFALLLFSIREMVMQSTKMRYDGPMDAILDVFNLMLARAREMMTADVLGTLLVGGIVAGILAERASKRWS
jgi:hypothetical protein